jgi:hypothetical protein
LLVNEDRIEDEDCWTNLEEKVIKHAKFNQTVLSYFVQLPVDDFNPHKLLEEMAEATRDYAETFILGRDWWDFRSDKGKQYVLFSDLWNRFDRYIEEVVKKDGSQYNCAPTTFYSRVRMWVDKGVKEHGCLAYAPNEKLLAR